MDSTVLPRRSKQPPGSPEVLPVHVALVVRYLPPHQLAAYTAFAPYFERLTVVVSTPMERHREWAPDWGNLEVQVQRTWTFRRPWHHAAGFTDAVDVHFPLDTISRLRALKPDVIVSGELGFRSLCSALYQARHPQTPLILWACVSEHTEQGRGWLRGRLRRWLMQHASAVIVNGASGRRYITGLGYDPERVFEIPYCCPAGMFDACADERHGAGATRLLYVGQLIERKGLHLFLERLGHWAAAHPDRGIEMRIVGTGPLRKSLESRQWPANL